MLASMLLNRNPKKKQKIFIEFLMDQQVRDVRPQKKKLIKSNPI